MARKRSVDTFVDTFARDSLPGTLWEARGCWRWKVKFPGKERREDVTLRMPFSGAKIPAGASTRSLAESAAWRLWEQAAKSASGGKGPCFTVNDLCDRWTAFAETYYSSSQEARDCTRGLRLFRRLYGGRPIEQMTHPDMLAYRAALVGEGYVRSTVNKYLGYVKRMAAWALDERMVSAQTKSELTAIGPLKRGRGGAAERDPITAVQDDVLERTCAELPAPLAAMLRVARLCGARPGEMCIMRWDDISRDGEVWVYRPGRHKNLYRNRPRAIVLGPRAQSIIEGMERIGEYVFSPRQCATGRRIGPRWSVEAVDRAVSRVCAARGIPHWHLNQLRHACATEVRRAFGMAAAGAVLGHTLGLKITDRYSFEAAEEEEIRSATPAMLAMG